MTRIPLECWLEINTISNPFPWLDGECYQYKVVLNTFSGPVTIELTEEIKAMADEYISAIHARGNDE
jgi:hypothetical protein